MRRFRGKFAYTLSSRATVVGVLVAASLVSATVPGGALAPNTRPAAASVWGKPSLPTCPTSGGVLQASNDATYDVGATHVFISVWVQITLNDSTTAVSAKEYYRASGRTTKGKASSGDVTANGPIGLKGSASLPGVYVTHGPQDATVKAVLVQARAKAIAQAATLRTALQARVTSLQKPGSCVTALTYSKDPVGMCSAPKTTFASCSTPNKSGTTSGTVKRGATILPAIWTLQATKLGKVVPPKGAPTTAPLRWTSAASADPVTDELVNATYLVKTRAGRAKVTLRVLGLRQVKVQISMNVAAKYPSTSGSFGFNASLTFVAAQSMFPQNGRNYAILDYTVNDPASWVLSNGTMSPPPGCDSVTVSTLQTMGNYNDPGSSDISPGDNARIYDPTNQLSEWAIDVPIDVVAFGDTAGNPMSCDVGPQKAAVFGFNMTERYNDPKTGLPLFRDLLRQIYPHSRIGTPVTHTFSIDLSRMGTGTTGSAQVTMTLTPQQHS